MKPLFVLQRILKNGNIEYKIKSVNKDLIEKDGFRLVYNKDYRLYIKGVDRNIRVR